jgi:hypothetical protein
MAKKKEGFRPSRNPLLERVDEHEKILALVIDKLNQIDNPQDPTSRIPHLYSDVEGIQEWIDRGWFGRQKDRFDELDLWVRIRLAAFGCVVIIAAITVVSFSCVKG